MSVGVLLILMVGLGAILMGLGYALGRAQAARGPASPEEPSPEAEGEGLPTPTAPPSPEPSPSVPAEEGLRVHTDPRKGHRLVVQVDGMAYVRYDAMSAEHRRRLRTYLIQIRDWMENTRGDVPLTPQRPTRRTSGDTAEFSAQATTAQAKDMISAIDAIVQAKLKAVGSQAAVKIMRDWRGTGVVILVNGTRYDAVADIPDEEVRGLLQEAVREWEAFQRRRKPAP